MKETKAQRQSRLAAIYNANENLSIDSLGGFNAVQKDHEWFVCKFASQTETRFEQWKLDQNQVDSVFDKSGIGRLEVLSEIVRQKRIAHENGTNEAYCS